LVRVTVLFLLAACLTAAGMVEKADNVTHRVLDLVGTLSWWEALRPFQMPHPIDATAFRPLSVLALKCVVALWGDNPPAWVTAGKGFACLAAFGLAAMAWLRAVGLTRVAPFAAALSMTLAPILFQVWYLPELDLLGAACTLGAMSLLVSGQPLDRVRQVAVAGGIGVALFLKESSALIQLGFLVALLASLLTSQGHPAHIRRVLRVLAVSGVAWGAAVWPMWGAPATDVGNMEWWEKLPLLEHNAVQLMHMASPAAGVLLLAWASTRLGVGPTTAGIAGCIGLVLAPMAIFYSHYEAIYYAPRAFGGGMALALVVGLVAAPSGRRKGIPPLVPWTVAAVFGFLSAIGLVAPSAREDMATRIFVALAPLLLATGLEAAWRLWALADSHKTRLGRVPIGILAATLVCHPLVSGINYTLDWRARHAVDLPAKTRLGTEDLTGELLLFNHYVEWLDPLGLHAAGASTLDASTDFLQVPAWLDPADYASGLWIHFSPPHDLAATLTQGQSAWLYWLSPRSQMSAATNEFLIGDLSWTRRRYGMFAPVASLSQTGSPLHNRLEDHRMSIYRTGSPLEELASALGDEVWRTRSTYVQLPLLWTELPRRLASGIPLVERYAYEGVLTRFPAAPESP
jgi:hypothetical protein